MTKLFNVLTDRDGIAQVLLYGYVGEGERVDAANVVAELMALENQYNKIAIHINSNGGDVFNGIAIYNALKSSKADITIYIDGIAASIASIIALCGKPLYMSKYAKLMLHAVQGGAFGNASELRKVADEIEGIQRGLSEMVAKKCGMDKDAIYSKYFADEKDHWISAQEALDMKIIDGIVEIEGDEDAPEPDSNVEAIQKYFNNRLSERESQIKFNMEFINQIKSIEAFKDASDEKTILAMIQGLVEKSALVDSLKTEIGNLKQTITEMNDKADAVFIDQAIADGKIKAEQKENFLNLMKADKENTMKIIDAFVVAPTPKPQPQQTPRAKDVFTDKNNPTFENMNWDELDKKGLLLELKNTNLELFKNKFKAQFGVDYTE